jgi:hypothetical protein
VESKSIFLFTVAGLSVAASLLILLAHIFSWTYLWAFMELFTGSSAFFLYVLYGMVILFSIIFFIGVKRKSRLIRILPFGINVITILLLVLVPFRAMGLRRDIQSNFEERLKVVHLIEDGQLLVNNRGMAKLPFYLRHLSKDGGFVKVEKGADGLQVFFFTFRGVLDNFSGILYSSSDVEPQNGIFGADVKESEKLKDNWYWIASW